jgi:UDP-N-acetylenolpyruvoylglucosamine reductase
MSRQLENYSIAMTKAEETLAKDNIEHLCMIRKVGEVTEFGRTVVKHLIKIGAGVSNDQLRRWCIKNGFQFKSNAIMVEVNFCGALGTCSHGAGLDTQTLADYVYEIEFIDHNGDRQVISKKTTPHLIQSAASAMGLLGPVVFVTLEMD